MSYFITCEILFEDYSTLELASKIPNKLCEALLEYIIQQTYSVWVLPDPYTCIEQCIKQIETRACILNIGDSIYVVFVGVFYDKNGLN